MLHLPAGYSHGTPYSRLVSYRTDITFYSEPYLETDAKKDIIQEEECYAGLCHFGLMSVAWQLVVPYHHRDDQVTETLACGSVHEHLPSTPALDVGDTNGREEQIAHTVDGSEQACHRVTESNRFYQNGRQIIRGNVDSCTSSVSDTMLLSCGVHDKPENCCMN
jgi:hypothetical protein